MGREPLEKPADLLPAYESLPNMVRRIVREEITPLVGLAEQMRELVADMAADTRAVRTG